jgi:hypothetical protein
MSSSDAKGSAYSSIGQSATSSWRRAPSSTSRDNGRPGPDRLAVAAAIGALFHVINHAIFKGCFLTSGSILYATGTKDSTSSAASIRLMPVSAVVAGIASLSIWPAALQRFFEQVDDHLELLLAGGATFTLVLFGIIALFTSTVTLACCQVLRDGLHLVGSSGMLGRRWFARSASMLAPSSSWPRWRSSRALPVLIRRPRPRRLAAVRGLSARHAVASPPGLDSARPWA